MQPSILCMYFVSYWILGTLPSTAKSQPVPGNLEKDFFPSSYPIINKILNMKILPRIHRLANSERFQIYNRDYTVTEDGSP